MCTLIVGRDALESRSVLLAANRDEDPARPTDPPRLLSDAPRVVGGRDRVAGGTWLALRDGEAAIALLNRWRGGAERPPPGLRSRGLLALDVAAAPRAAKSRAPGRDAAEGDPLALGALERAWETATAARYAPFSLVFASARACWLMAWEGAGSPRVSAIPPGWHVLTHREMDDPAEPRAAYLAGRLAAFRPRELDQAERALMEQLRSHGEDATPPVCLHGGPVATVSSSLIWIATSGMRYRHAEGPPCRSPFADHTTLADGGEPGGGT